MVRLNKFFARMRLDWAVRRYFLIGATAFILLGAALVVGGSLGKENLSLARQAAVRVAVKDFFGDSANQGNVRFASRANESGMIDITTNMGGLSMEWPSREVVAGRLNGISPDPEKSARFPLGEVDNFVQTHFPWALVGSERKSYSVGESGQSEVIQWRSRVRGVLMPMRLDVVADRGGQVVAFAARHVGPQTLPSAILSRDDAATSVTSTSNSKVVASELLVKIDKKGAWRVCWMFGLEGDVASQGSFGKGEDSSSVIIVDATTGAKIPASEFPAIGGPSSFDGIPKEQFLTGGSRAATSQARSS